MPSEKYLKLRIDKEELDIDGNSDFPIVFDYQLEDVENFQKKKSSESIGMKLPATLKNQRVLNTFHNSSVEDNTPLKNYSGIRTIVAEANGDEIFVGKAIAKRAKRKGGIPTLYEINAFGNNADWMIDLKDVTLYDILKKINFIFDKNTVVNSWEFDGKNPSLPYVFAPVKYAGPLDPDANDDKAYHIKTMKPSISKFWTIFWAFQSLGYRIKSNFLDSEYYRRQVMPWTFGNFLTSEGTKYDIHKFMAKGDKDRRWDGDMNSFVDLNVQDSPTPGFDNNNTIAGGDYSYSSPTMKWKYNTPHYGPLDVTFSIAIFFYYKIDLSSEVGLEVHWFKNGVLAQKDIIFNHTAPTLGSTQGADLAKRWFSTSVNDDDEITCKVKLRIFESKTATVARCVLRVDQFQIDYFKIPVGGEVSFDSYLNLQKYKFLDFLRGEIDLFNLSFQTDPINKEVLIEPTHEYSTNNDMSVKQKGYFNGNVIDWTKKEDVSEESDLEIYDDNSREFVFKFKDDSNDGALKIIQDRYKITLASGKYVFAERFKAEKKEFENRFYSPTMHYLVDEFSGITSEVPQMVCLVPENISNTSSGEAENTFLPKSAYYKGRVSGVGGWKFKDKDSQIETYTDYPYLFAVNYKPGGENDPILSYSDEKIGSVGNYAVGKGLLKRFFHQRLAIMNNGQWLTSKFYLNNKDITNWFHQERINIDGELFELINIKAYNALKDQSTQCIMRKWVPVTENDEKNTYPSRKSILTNAVVVMVAPAPQDSNVIDKVFDSQYNRLMCLYTDIPR